MYFIIAISISAVLFIGTLTILFIFYLKKKKTYEKAKKADNDLGKIDFNQENDYLKK